MALEKVMEIIKNMGSDEEKEEIPDDQTRDKYLRSLRREKRVLDEEEEKVALKKEIEERKREKMKKHLFGIKDKMEKKKQLIEALNKKKKINILKEKKANTLKNQRIEKTENILSDNNSWFNQGDL